MCIKKPKAYGRIKRRASFQHRVLLGRGPQCDVVFGNTFFSRAQLKISYDSGSARVYIQNLSRNVLVELKSTKSILGCNDIGLLTEGETISYPTLGITWRVKKKYTHTTRSQEVCRKPLTVTLVEGDTINLRDSPAILKRSAGCSSMDSKIESSILPDTETTKILDAMEGESLENMQPSIETGPEIERPPENHPWDRTEN